MMKDLNHVTLVVSNIEKAKAFFALFGFEVIHDLIIEKEPFVTYMYIKDLKAQHVTMRPKDSKFEIQLLYFFSPSPQYDHNIHRLDKIGYNHICFTVDDIDDAIDKLKIHGINILSDVMTFNNRKLAYIEGPDKIIMELAEWV